MITYIEQIALAGESQLAVVPLVVQHVNQVHEHLPAVAADQDVRVTCVDTFYIISTVYSDDKSRHRLLFCLHADWPRHC